MKQRSENQTAKVNNASRNGWWLWVGLLCIFVGLGLLSLQVFWKWGIDTHKSLLILLPVIELFLIGAGIWLSVKHWHTKERNAAQERLQSAGSGERGIDVEACDPRGLEPTANLVRTDMIIDVIAVVFLVIALIITSTINLQTRNEVHRNVSKVLQEYSSLEKETIKFELTSDPNEASAQIDTSLNAIIIHRPIPPILDICNAYDDKVGGVIPKEYWSAIIIAILGLVVGLLGLKRIEGFDKEIRESHKDLRFLLYRELKGMVAMIPQDTKDELKKYRDDSISAFDERIVLMETKLAPLEKNIKKVKELLELPEISSVSQAHNEAYKRSQQGNTAQGISILNLIVSGKIQGGPDDFFNSAMQAYKLENPVLARDIAQKGLESYPNNVDLSATYAKALAETGNTQEAMNQFKEILKLNPNARLNWRYTSFKVDALMAENRFEEALKELDEQMKVTIYDPRPYTEKAILLDKHNRLDEAKACLDEALSKGIKDEALLREYADILIQMGKAQDAIPYLEEALLMSSELQNSVDEHVILYLLANAYERVGNIEAAILNYKRIIRIKPSSIQAIRAEERLKIIDEKYDDEEAEHEEEEGVTLEDLINLYEEHPETRELIRKRIEDDSSIPDNLKKGIIEQMNSIDDESNQS